MSSSTGPKLRCGTLVIGGSQAGLATAYHLSKLGEDVQVFDALERIGDAWRQRWTSLRLFTPAQHDSLPGMDFPAARGVLPTKDEMADYLSTYAQQFALPVYCGIRVSRLTPTASGFDAETDQGVFTANQVVIATGGHTTPKIPPFAAHLNPSIVQLHSSQYRDPSMIPEGDVLVVGAATSGGEIALELAKTHRTHLAGKATPHIPGPLLKYAGDLYWLFISHVLTERTPVGKKAKAAIRGRGGPLIGISMDEVVAAGVERHPRVVGVRGGMPLLDNDRVLEVASVVWATGFRPSLGWVAAPIADEMGWPKAKRGVSSVIPGLYFVGMVFQFGLTSGLLGGVGRDAEFVANAIHRAR